MTAALPFCPSSFFLLALLQPAARIATSHGMTRNLSPLLRALSMRGSYWTLGAPVERALQALYSRVALVAPTLFCRLIMHSTAK